MYPLRPTKKSCIPSTHQKQILYSICPTKTNTVSPPPYKQTCIPSVQTKKKEKNNKKRIKTKTEQTSRTKNTMYFSVKVTVLLRDKYECFSEVSRGQHTFYISLI
jgi:hypothetical protein